MWFHVLPGVAGLGTLMSILKKQRVQAGRQPVRWRRAVDGGTCALKAHPWDGEKGG